MRPAVKMTVKLNRRQMRELRRMLKEIPRGLPRVMTRAINKVATAARAKIIRAIAAEFTVRQSDIRKRNIKLSKATFRRLRALVKIFGRRIGLISFQARRLKKGVSYKIRKGGGREKIAGAFFATMKSGHRGVFQRRGRARFPIVELRGPSVPEAMENMAELARGTLDAELAGRLDKEITTQAGLLIERHTRKAG